MNKVTEQKKLDFIRSTIRKYINATGKADTPACMMLGKDIGVSHMTLYNALQGKVSFRTVEKMIDAGWFTLQDFSGIDKPKTSRTSPAAKKNDSQAQKVRERQAYKRGHDQGYREGFEKGKERGRAEFAGNAYQQGYNDGVRETNRVRASDSRSARVQTPQGISIEKLEKLFNLSKNASAADGEKSAARNAAGKILGNWIKERFGDEVSVKVTS